MAERTPDPGPQSGDLTPWAARSTGPLRLSRGLRGRCPRCGSGGISDGFFSLKETCPSCNWTFEREEGYWLGAMIILFAAVELSYAIFLAVGIIGYWPDPHWTALLYLGLALNGTVPFLLYRWSKTTWMGLHTAFVPAELERDGASRSGV